MSMKRPRREMTQVGDEYLFSFFISPSEKLLKQMEV
jgi:hypothetical protein